MHIWGKKEIKILILIKHFFISNIVPNITHLLFLASSFHASEPDSIYKAFVACVVYTRSATRDAI